MDWSGLLAGKYKQPTKDINVGYAVNQVLSDRFLTKEEKDRILSVFAQTTPVQGHLDTQDVVRGAVGAGVGTLGAKYLGTVIGGMFGKLNPKTMGALQQTGAVAGALRGSGLWR